jgi:hypothetical protein
VTFVRSTEPGSSKWFATAQDRLRVQSGDSQAFAKFRASLAAGRGLTSATLTARGEAALTGTWTARSVDPATGAFQNLTWDTRPAVVAGSADRTATLAGDRATWDVKADIDAMLAAELDKIAFRISASSGTAQWLRTPSLELTLVTYALAVDPTDISPNGTVGTAKPKFTWTAPKGISKVQVQVANTGTTFSASTGFTSTLWDSTQLSQTVPEVDSSTGGAWSGISGTGAAAVRHFTTGGGWSNWVQVSVTYDAPTNFVVSNPGATDADPTPPSVWTPAADAVQIITYRDGEQVDDTGLIAGPISNYTPTKGAKKAGQVLDREYHFHDGIERTQPATIIRTTSTTYTPKTTVAGLTTITADQYLDTPAVTAAWTRAAGTPDEVGIHHDDDWQLNVDGPTGTYLDWTVAPNTDVIYGGRAVVNGEQSDTIRTDTIHTTVTGVWLVDPLTERGFVLAGIDGLEISMGGEVVVHTPIDGAYLLRHTLTLRGPEGNMVGRIDEWPGRTLEEQKADAEWLRERPQRILRLILGDLNIPVACSSLQVMFDKTDFRIDRPAYNVSFAFSHAEAP